MKSEAKEKYEAFCKETYVPIYSKAWWMDVICGEENWDVWFYEPNGEVLAVMPYYKIKRGQYEYITKAPFTQNNGIIFKDKEKRKRCSQAAFEEKVITEACHYIEELSLDVYEQQYQYEFTNWLPFFWQQYSAVTRYTYVIENTSDLEQVWSLISSNYRNKIRKGEKNCRIKTDIDKWDFYYEHEKIFLKQGLTCPLSAELWNRLYDTCLQHEAGTTLCAVNEEEKIQSVLFCVWDEKSMYQILGGNIPEYQKKDTYAYLIWKAIQNASQKELCYDFEGSVIPRIARSFREFGGEPKPYFRIRKVFREEIIRQEEEQRIKQLRKEESK